MEHGHHIRGPNNVFVLVGVLTAVAALWAGVNLQLNAVVHSQQLQLQAAIQAMNLEIEHQLQSTETVRTDLRTLLTKIQVLEVMASRMSQIDTQFKNIDERTSRMEAFNLKEFESIQTQMVKDDDREVYDSKLLEAHQQKIMFMTRQITEISEMLRDHLNSTGSGI